MTKIVGILNITPDSFSDGGKFNSLQSAISHLNLMLEDGASVIDVGSESTRPNSIKLTSEEEWKRLENILPEIAWQVKRFNKKHGFDEAKIVKISIDSYHVETIKKSYEMGVDIVNDVSGFVDERIVEFIADNKMTAILMHNLSIHANPDLIINQHLDLIEEILVWARKKISYLESNGVKKSQLIFDPGIGFGKNASQSIKILKNIDSFRVLSLPLYVGHSKKSFLDTLQLESFDETSGSEKLLNRSEKTLVISKFLARKNVEFLRVHDVAENLRSIGLSCSARYQM